MSIGHGMIGMINNENSILYDEDISEEELGATQKSALIFKNINLFQLTTYEEFEIYITIVWNIILLTIMFTLRKKLDVIQAIFLILTILVLNIFDFNLAKEPIQMLYFVMIYIVITSKSLKDGFKYLAAFGILYWASVSYRDYYIGISN